MLNLIEGYRRFRETYFAEHRELFSSLGRLGQAPKILLIGCSDSRVDPALIFSVQPGELFVLRNVANLIPPYSPDVSHHGTSAAIEFAVRVLKVEHIVVLGHSGCGGVRALVEDKGPGDSDFIGAWMSLARSARDRAFARTLSTGQPADVTLRICEQEVVVTSMANLMTFPWVRDRAEQGLLLVHGWWFDVEQGSLHLLDPINNTFRPV